MKRNVLLLAALVPVVGCGNLSQEDLLFLGAIPAKEALEVRPAGAVRDNDAPGTATGAMQVECTQPLDVKCQARNIATGLNTITFDLLRLVDAVVQFPPSKREPGRRVWGPFFDFQKQNTARFEMTRINGGTTYRFCLHAVDGRIRDRDADDVTCDTDTDEDSGLVKFLDGTLSPGTIDGARARFGQGQMTLHTGRIPDLAAFGRTMTIDFDNSEDRTDIFITVDGQVALGDVLERDPLEYAFTREADGSGDFGFVMFANIHNPEDPDEANLIGIERLDMVAQWNSDEAGVGRARVTEGDLGAEEFLVDQCWGGDDVEVFLAADFTGDAEPRTVLPPYVAADEDKCVFAVADVPLPEL